MNQALRTWIGGTQNKNWDIILPNVVLVYNNFVHTATKYPPSRLFFGREISPPDIPIIPKQHPALSKYEYLETIRQGQHIACLIARMNQRKMDQRQRPQHPREHRAEPERYEVGDLVQVRNQAPVDKLSSPWEKVFVVTRVLPNAVRCVHWRIDLHPPFKLHQEPKDMGQVEEKLVHVKDVKKWDSDLPPGHVWDEKLVETLLQSVEPPSQARLGSSPSSAASTIGRATSGPVGPSDDLPPEDDKLNEPRRAPPTAPTRTEEDVMSSPARMSPPRERYRFPSPVAPPTTTSETVTLDAEESLVDYYQLANQANELLQKTADGRRVLHAFQGKNHRFEKVFDAYREAQEQPGVVLGPPPRPTTIQDRLEDLVPGPRARPLLKHAAFTVT